MADEAWAPIERYVRGPLAQAWVDKVASLARDFAERAALHDREGSLPTENVAALRAVGYPSLTVPATAGGAGAGLYDLCLLQEILATGDGATALGVGWHLSLMLGLAASGAWPESARTRLFASVVEHGALANSCATERETGSPSRGGLPATRARVRADGGFALTGRKTFATFSQALDWYLVTATLDDDSVGEFLLPRGTPGVRIEETWDSLGMRATASHDLVLDDAPADADALVDRFTPPAGRPQRSADAGGPLLHVPACYLGIALAARRELVAFAWRHRPNSLPGPIAELPAVQDQLGRIDLTLARANAMLFDAAAAWDQADSAGRQRLRAHLGAVKVAGTEAAVEAVDLCMRVVGGHSLARQLPFERHFRDVRAGLHNPPMADLALRALGRAALDAGRPKAEADA